MAKHVAHLTERSLHDKLNVEFGFRIGPGVSFVPSHAEQWGSMWREDWSFVYESSDGPIISRDPIPNLTRVSHARHALRTYTD